MVNITKKLHTLSCKRFLSINRCCKPISLSINANIQERQGSVYFAFKREFYITVLAIDEIYIYIYIFT